ncbi:MAG: bifunctional adenosylcobinamide kinase/adenosylcobinamide-phosphate guanylyltransferase [Mycolicibacterium sp.]|uniref:bifunctional adenosylcobinamide kinase/adenosylcobinamide-phosphate guanylyltransferase n=1 Tax=Mycolicibacterium sp. TaxID=2320850 RepID=UPI003D0AF26B
MRILVTGGVRSGKSGHAVSLLSAAEAVTFIAPGRPADGSDPDWDARVARHRADRPTHWTTVETAEVAESLTAVDGGAVLLDCLGTWLTAHLDSGRLWEKHYRDMHSAVTEHTDILCESLSVTKDCVVVTNEVGLGVVPEHRSGMVFRDLLGIVNQRVASVCDEVHLVIAGRVLQI